MTYTVDNPVCKMVWERGEPVFTSVFGYPRNATHWHPVDVPDWPTVNRLTTFNGQFGAEDTAHAH